MLINYYSHYDNIDIDFDIYCNYIKTGVPLPLYWVIESIGKWITIGECIIKGFEIISGRLDLDLTITNLDPDYLGYKFTYFVGPVYINGNRAYIYPTESRESYNAVALI